MEVINKAGAGNLDSSPAPAFKPQHR